ALRAMGVGGEERDDGFAVTGAPRLAGGRFDALGDHRLAMLGAVAGLASAEGVAIEGFEAAAVSYPGFWRDLGAVGAGAGSSRSTGRPGPARARSRARSRAGAAS